MEGKLNTVAAEPAILFVPEFAKVPLPVAVSVPPTVRFPTPPNVPEPVKDKLPFTVNVPDALVALPEVLRVKLLTVRPAKAIVLPTAPLIV